MSGKNKISIKFGPKLNDFYPKMKFRVLNKIKINPKINIRSIIIDED
jgi:hypothetical protein